MRLWITLKSLSVMLLISLAALFGAACQQETANTNGAANTANSNASTTANVNANANSNAGASSTSSIAAREPEKYTARMVFTGQASGQNQKLEVPLEVARNGADRRYALTLPVIGQVVFLDRADKRYIIIPSQKQYAELTPEVTGFDVRSLTPVQMVAQLEKMQGVEQVGEESINGRTALKYRAAARANTASQAGQVATENFIYVDKETGLPLRWDGYGQSTGSVQGVNNVRIVAETKEIKTDVDPTLFEVPQNMRKLTPEEMKRYANALAGFVGMVLNNINAQSGATAGSGAAPTAPAAPSPSPAATAGH